MAKRNDLERKCLECGALYYSYNRAAKYCSRLCHGTHKRTFYPMSCHYCGEGFTPAYKGRKYCSMSCRDSGRKEIRSCLLCREKFQVHRCVIRRGGMAGQFCSQKCVNSYRVTKNNPNWRGGISFEPYSTDFNNATKEAARNETGRRCASCGDREDSLPERLCVHHIDYNKKNCSRGNLVPLCRSCHGKTNGDRARWTAVFTDIWTKWIERESIINISR